MFKKYDRVKVNIEEKEEHGVVIQKEANKLKVMLDNGRVIKGFHTLFQKSDKKGKNFKKNDRVETKFEGKIVYGTVVKGGSKKIEVMLDNEDAVIAGFAFAFDKTDKELPKDKPTIMDKYSIKNWHEIEGHGDSRTFNADIYYQGEKVIRVSNNGWGGENLYQDIKRGSYGKLQEDTQTWIKELGFKFKKEDMCDVWVEWYQYGRPYGRLAVDEIKKYEDLLKKYLKY